MQAEVLGYLNNFVQLKPCTNVSAEKDSQIYKLLEYRIYVYTSKISFSICHFETQL